MLVPGNSNCWVYGRQIEVVRKSGVVTTNLFYIIYIYAAVYAYQSLSTTYINISCSKPKW
jgi:hypothetical protein